jgi:nicotinamidase-related amidase
MTTALLIVDVQRSLVDELAPTRRAALLKTLAEVLAHARGRQTPIVFIRHDDGGGPLAAGSPGWEIAHEIAPRAGEPIIDKRFRDAFRETRLADVLAQRSADHVIIGGMQTEFCIDSTIREAERRGFRVTLIADGHATYAADGLSEDQIRAHVHRVAREEIAQIVPAAELLATPR